MLLTRLGDLAGPPNMSPESRVAYCHGPPCPSAGGTGRVHTRKRIDSHKPHIGPLGSCDMEKAK